MGALAARHLRGHRGLIALLVLGLAAFEIILIHVAAELDEGPGLQEMLGMLPSFVQDVVAAYVADITFPNAVAVGFIDPASVVPSLAFVIMLATIPAADRETGALDLYLTRPITRGSYLSAPVLCIVVSAVLLPASLLVGCIAGLALTDGPGEMPWTHYVMSAVSLATMLLAAGGISLAVAAGEDRRGTAIVKVVAILVVTYTLEFLSFFWTALRWVVWISPFHYFKPIPGALEGDLSPGWNAAVLAGLFLATTAIAYRRFQRRDV